MARRGDDRYPVCSASNMDAELDVSSGKWVARIARWRRINRIEHGNISHELSNGARPRPRPIQVAS